MPNEPRRVLHWHHKDAKNFRIRFVQNIFLCCNSNKKQNRSQGEETQRIQSKKLHKSLLWSARLESYRFAIVCAFASKIALFFVYGSLIFPKPLLVYQHRCFCLFMLALPSCTLFFRRRNLPNIHRLRTMASTRINPYIIIRKLKRYDYRIGDYVSYRKGVVLSITP